MAQMDPKVMEMVERALESDPGVGSSDLFERAKKRFPSVGDLSIRQFHARYPLQVKRRRSRDAEASPAKAAPRRSLRGRKRASATTESSSRPARGRPRRRPAMTEAAPRSTANSTSNAPHARDRVRAILLSFATELASVEAKVDVVKVLAGADQYVDQLMSALDS